VLCLKERFKKSLKRSGNDTASLQYENKIQTALHNRVQERSKGKTWTKCGDKRTTT
jgi:hypothetical protein